MNALEERLQTDLAELILNTSLHGWFSCNVVYDDKGNIIDFVVARINKGFTDLTGLEEKHAIGKSYLSLFPRSREQGVFDLNVRVYQTGISERKEIHFPGDNAGTWFRIAVAKLGINSIIVTFDDITESKEQYQEIIQKNNLLDSILANSSNGISVSKIFRDEEGKVIDALTILANDAAVKYIGLPREIYLTKKATEIEPEIMTSDYYRMCVHTLATGEPFVTQYFMHATQRWLELTVSRLDPDHLIHIFTDVTPIKEAQLKLEKSIEELRRSNNSLEEFTATASHDLKEPIRKVHYFTERLKSKLEGRLTEEEQSIMERVENATARMTLLVDDLLEYSHVNRGTREAETVNLDNKINLILSDLELLIHEKKAKFDISELPTVKGYRRQLQQLFHNLIANAIKYSQPGIPPKITIDSHKVQGKHSGMNVRPDDQEKQFHVVTVRDNGIGFEPEFAEKIFNIFTRLHGNKEYKGTGVGLAIAKKVVENHGGYIAADSIPGEGATFRVLLPAE